MLVGDTKTASVTLLDSMEATPDTLRYFTALWIKCCGSVRAWKASDDGIRCGARLVDGHSCGIFVIMHVEKYVLWKLGLCGDVRLAINPRIHPAQYARYLVATIMSTHNTVPTILEDFSDTILSNIATAEPVRTVTSETVQNMYVSALL